MRLIDADALKKLVKQFRNDAPQSSVRKYVCDVILSMLGDENQTPTIEAEPVRHGRWVDAEDDGGGTLWHCSKCRKPVKTFCLPPNYDYCPHCGADMRDIPTKSLSPEGQKLYDTLLTRVKMDGGADNG